MQAVEQEGQQWHSSQDLPRARLLRLNHDNARIVHTRLSPAKRAQDACACTIPGRGWHRANENWQKDPQPLCFARVETPLTLQQPRVAGIQMPGQSVLAAL